MTIHENTNLSSTYFQQIELFDTTPVYVETEHTRSYNIEIRGTGGDHIVSTIYRSVVFRYKMLDEAALNSMVRVNPDTQSCFGVMCDLPDGTDYEQAERIWGVNLDHDYQMNVWGVIEKDNVFGMLKGDRHENEYILPPENADNPDECDKVENDPVIKVWCNDRIGMRFVLKTEKTFDRSKLKIHTFLFEGNLLVDEVSYEGKYLDQKKMYVREDEGRRAKIIWH